jgi:hypothetical protein
MKRILYYLIIIISVSLSAIPSYSQKDNNSVNQIIAADLESYVNFLASPLLKGRMNGEEELDIAAQFIASQVKLIGLKPANRNSYLQPYSILKTTIDPDKTSIRVVTDAKDTTTVNKPFYQLIPTGPTDLELQGEVVFAGYGIKSEKYKYNDFENLNAEGKIILVMERAPMSEDGKNSTFQEPEWSSRMSFQLKIGALLNLKAKAILFVPDPKSGLASISESGQGFAEYISAKTSLKGEPEEKPNPFMAMMPKMMFIDRTLADELLKGSGHTLEELQKNIDATFKPNSFLIPNKQLIIKEVTRKEEKIMNNVAGFIEGSDPVLKNEIVVFSGHYDHIGVSGSGINTGADDNASGCAALLSIAEAFQNLKKKPLRSILFLWVSGEEIGLYGSKFYVNSPLFPLDKTVADLNMDMIGRVKEAADSTKDTPMTGPNSVFVITGNQSKELIAIADEVDKKSLLDLDYSLSGRDHPLQLFARSDHYNFVAKDIPVLFFTSGIHSDYHTPGDVIEKIDFKKMELITRTMYEIGLTVANRKTRLVVDNPFSSWGKSK